MSAAGRGRVLYILSVYPVLSETFVRNEIAALRDNDIDVRVLALREGAADGMPAGWAGGFEVPLRPAARAVASTLAWWATRHPGRLLRLLVLLIALRGRDARMALTVLPRALRPHLGVEAVHTHFGWRASAPCLFASVLLGAPSSVTLHANDIYVPTDDLSRKLRRFTRLVTVCRYNVEIVRRLTSPSTEVTVVPCGVSVPPEEPMRIQGAHLLSVGRMVPKKGFSDLIAAMDIVRRHRPDATLEIIGDGAGRAELEAQVQRRGLADCVSLPGPRANPDVLEAMAASSVFVLACARETNGGSDALPVVIREAMVRGRPVVSTDVAGIPETLNGVGWVVRSGDVVALAEAILDALSDAAEAQRRGHLARRRVQERHTLAHTAEGMKRVFELGNERN